MTQIGNSVWMASITDPYYENALSWMSTHSTRQRAEAALHNQMAEQLEEHEPDSEIIDPATKRVKKTTSAKKVMEQWDLMTRGECGFLIEEVPFDAKNSVQFVGEELNEMQEAAAAAGVPLKIIGGGQIGSIK
jgi:hypothetical protein